MRIYAKKVNRLLAESKNMLTFAIVMLGQASAVIARNQVSVHPPLSKLAGSLLFNRKYYKCIPNKISVKSVFY